MSRDERFPWSFSRSKKAFARISPRKPRPRYQQQHSRSRCVILHRYWDHFWLIRTSCHPCFKTEFIVTISLKRALSKWTIPFQALYDWIYLVSSDIQDCKKYECRHKDGKANTVVWVIPSCQWSQVVSRRAVKHTWGKKRPTQIGVNFPFCPLYFYLYKTLHGFVGVFSYGRYRGSNSSLPLIGGELFSFSTRTPDLAKP